MSQKRANNAFAALKRHKYVSLTTFRKNGKPVSTPVWFVEEDGKLYVWTRRDSGKIKRIRNISKVQFVSCTLRGKVVGPTMEGVARILAPNEEVLAERGVRRKYSWKIRLGNLFGRFRREERVYVEIVPAERKQ